MEWNEHWNLAGKHALLGASSHSWLNYDVDKLRSWYANQQKRERGTELHALASSCINNRIKLANLKKAINQFVNDAIGFRMESEKVLYYSDNCFGTADAIRYDGKELRIHDLKTGDGPVRKFSQLDIYAALFCLEYGVNPKKIDIVERLYQGNGWLESIPEPNDISEIMDRIILFDKIIEEEKTY